MIPLEPDRYYHIYNHANGVENIFRTDENYTFFLSKYTEYINPIADSFAYCLMPIHFHFLIQMKDSETLYRHKKKISRTIGDSKDFNAIRFTSQCFSNLFNSFSKAYNLIYNRRGSLFNQKFKRKLIEDERYFTTLIFYIHANPVHHGFVKAPEDWKYSSYHALLSEKKAYLDRKKVLDWVGGRKEFIRFHQQWIEIKVASAFENFR